MFGEISHGDAVVIISTACVTEDKIRGKRDIFLYILSFFYFIFLNSPPPAGELSL